jgi:transcriptional regulator with XRE-family HTH domain
MGQEGAGGRAQRFAELRLGTGMSRRQLAEMAGVTHTAVSRAERGRSIRRETAEALESVLGVVVWEAVTLWPPAPADEAESVVATIRRQRRETLPDAASRIGVSDGVLARAERGQGVHPANAKRIADAYGIGVLDVLPPRQEGEETAAVA